mmetsp:Transcript_30646/g.77211  ORF Transcript_30646/g.77211 Transcript_30646/m.77211 type:complete len:233 (-) Transcript_30646:452-1150(-)
MTLLLCAPCDLCLCSALAMSVSRASNSRRIASFLDLSRDTSAWRASCSCTTFSCSSSPIMAALSLDVSCSCFLALTSCDAWTWLVMSEMTLFISSKRTRIASLSNVVLEDALDGWVLSRSDRFSLLSLRSSEVHLWRASGAALPLFRSSRFLAAWNEICSSNLRRADPESRFILGLVLSSLMITIRGSRNPSGTGLWQPLKHAPRFLSPAERFETVVLSPSRQWDRRKLNSV